MKAGWQIKKLGDICDILDNQRKPITKRDRKVGEYPYYGATGILDLVEGYLFDEDLVLVGEDGAKWVSGENTAFAVTGKCWVNNHAHVLRPHRSELTDSWLIHYLVHSDLLEFVSGMTVPKLNQGSLREIPIPLPPLPEQQRIVIILNEAFECIAIASANAKKNLANARELFESYLQSVFTNKGEGWEGKTLGEIADVEYGYTDKSTEEGDYRYIRITDIDKNGELILDEKKYIKYSKEAKSFLVEDNDLLMARTGATFAKVLLYKDYQPSVFASYLIRIKFNGKIENELYWYFTKTQFYWEQANNLSSGAAQPHFNGKAVKQLIFPYPKSVKEQKVLIDKFNALSKETKKLEAIYKQKLSLLEELKKSILNQAFTGQIA